MSRVTAPLFTADARDLWLLHRPRWQRRLLAWTLPVAMFALLATHTVAVGEATCTAQVPCGPDWMASGYIGLLAASAGAGLIYPRLAARFSSGVRVAGETREINVCDAVNYPVGQKIELFVDNQGLRQPVAEPYDATLWLLLGVLLAGIGAACRARGRERGQGARQFFHEEQPVT